MANLIGMMFKRFNSGSIIEPVSLMSASVYYAYTSLLLKSASTNSLDNNTFVDSSVDELAVTPTGDVTQGSLSPFSPGEWSGYFDGSGDYLTVPASTALQFGTGDFSVEAWINSEALTSTYTRMIVGTGYYVSSADRGWGLGLNTTGKLTFWMAGSTGTAFTLTETVARQLYTWTHVAVTRSGSIVTLWVDGIAVATGVSAYDENYSRILKIGTSENSAISPALGNSGASFKGSISNLRIVKGTAVYSESFIPPTSALAIDANTSLLTLNKSSISDMSTNSFNISVVGDTRTYGLGPVNNDETDNGYSFVATRNGGVMNSISIPATTALALDNSNFTIEFWCKLNGKVSGDTAGASWPIISANSVGGGYWNIRTGHPGYNSYWNFITNATGMQSGNIGAYGSSVGGPTINYGLWQHIAITRVGTSLNFYINGSLWSTGTYAGTEASTVTSGTTSITIGNTNAAICNLRIVKGTAVYTGNFCPPAAALTAVPGTILLTCQGSSIIDQSSNNLSLTLNGGAAMTSGSFLGTIANSGKSVIFNGNSYIRPTDNSAFDISTGDWTLETWVNPTKTTSTSFIYVNRATSALVSFAMYLKSTNNLEVYFRTAAGVQFGLTATADNSVPLNAWTHIAVVKSGTNAYIYLNGVLSNTIALSSNVIAPGQLVFVGGDWNASYFVGYISNLRLVKGTALYTTTFTPSTDELTAVAGTALLLCQDGSIDDKSSNAFKVAPIGGDILRSKLGPYPDPWSYYCAFDGSGDYLSVPANSANTIGTSDFTLEYWINPTTSSVHRYVISSHQIGGMIAVSVNSSNRLELAVNTSGGGSSAYSSFSCSTTVVPSNTWTHCAVVRSGTLIKIYINGVADTSTLTLAANTNIGSYNGPKPFYIGAGPDLNSYFTGGISNVRFVKGTAVYTGNFTVPAEPLTVIDNTQWLVSKSSGFTDVGPNNYTVTANGNAAMVKLNSSSIIQDSTPWSTYFDGSGDYLVVPASTATDILPGSFTVETWIKPNTVLGEQFLLGNYPERPGSVRFDGASYLSSPDNVGFEMGSGNFTIECWIYVQGTNPGNGASIISKSATNSYGPFALGFYPDGKLQALSSLNGTGWGVTCRSTTVTHTTLLNTWTHIAYVRNASSFNLYVNGVSVASATNAGTLIDNTNDLMIGYVNYASTYFTGLISNVRIIKGTALYTSDFAVPTAELSAVTNTQLLTCRGPSIVDLTGSKTMTLNGQPVVDSGSPFLTQFDLNSVYFNGTTSYLSFPANGVVDVPTSTTPFTVEGWVYLTRAGGCMISEDFTNVAGYQPISMVIGFAATASAVSGNTGGLYPFFSARTATTWSGVVSPSPLSLNTWYHIAGVFTGTQQDLYVNGSQVATAARAAWPTVNEGTTCYIGRRWDTQGTPYFQGYISNVRFVRGTAVYTGNFTPPTTNLPVVTNTTLLTCQGTTTVDAAGVVSITTNGTIVLSTQSPYTYSPGWGLLLSGGYLAMKSTPYAHAISTNTSKLVSAGRWNHIAMTGDGTTVNCYLNGELLLTGTQTLTSLTKEIFIGGYQEIQGSSYFSGFMSDLRIEKGKMAYDSAFTPSSVTLPVTTGTALATLQDPYIKDNSTNNFSVSTYGNTKIMNVGPFDDINYGYSAYFDGTGDALTVSNGASLSGDFTVECWFYKNANTNQMLCGPVGNNNYIYVTTTGIGLAIGITYPSFPVATSSGQWYHLAITRVSNVLHCWLNGVEIAGTNTTLGGALLSGSFYIGLYRASPYYYWNGYISNFRIVNGTALYTSNFTPSTTNLTAVTGTSLLTLQDLTLKDNSTNQYTITTSGNVTITAFGPFKSSPTSIATYSKSLHGGSAYFNALGDKLDFPAVSLDGDFTAETWFYRNEDTENTIFTNSTNSDQLTVNTNGGVSMAVDSVKVISNAGTGVKKNSWNHIAWSRSGSNCAAFVNGTRVATGTSSAVVDVSQMSVPLVGEYQETKSVYFNGSSYLTAPSNAALNFGTGDFTVEAWINVSNVSGTKAIGGIFASGTGGWYLGLNNASLRFSSGIAGGDYDAGTITANSWTHVAATRSGNSLRMFINGTQVNTTTDISGQNFNLTNTLNIGRLSVAGWAYTGYISNLRIVKGTAVYTGNFTTPTTKLAAITGTSLLTCQGNSIADASTNNFTITNQGSAQISDLTPIAPRFVSSSTSISFNGITDYLKVPTNSAFAFGTGDYTMECWIYPTTTSIMRVFEYSTNQDNVDINISSTGTVNYYNGTTSQTSAGGLVVVNTWTHIATVRLSGTVKVYVNGVLAVTQATTPNTTTARVLNIAGVTNNLFVGYISNVRIVKGTAVYTSNFTVPTTNLTAITGTSLLTGQGGSIKDYSTNNFYLASSGNPSVTNASPLPGGINGYISDARLVNALVTGYEPSNTSITIPTAPLSAVTGTKLLLKMSNAGIYDAAAKGVSETYGNVMTSTAQVKYGPTSIYFDGVGDYLYNPVSAEYEFGTGNFTIETWVYFNDLSSTYSPICQSDVVGTSTNTKWFFAYTAGTLKFSTHASGGFSATTAWTPVTGTWYHVAVTRDSARMRLFIDGVSGGASGTTTVSGTPVGYSLGQNGLSIGAMSSLPSASYLNGYLEDLRITKGVARYTDTFIPPTEAF